MATIITTKAHGDVPVPSGCTVKVDRNGGLVITNDDDAVVDAWLPNGWVSFRVDNDHHKG